ncbi:hypothetical protein RB195_004331 [Necator americanus]|uniref:Uncharacterized protein n=1 Tax=Necator americanus TaxID=51031 RepID=A0ABR1BLK9_NECAM
MDVIRNSWAGCESLVRENTPFARGWTDGAYLLEGTPNCLVCTFQFLDCRLLDGPTVGVQWYHEPIPVQQKQEVHPLNPPESQGRHKIAFGPRLASSPPSVHAPRGLAVITLMLPH